ncbi:MAG: type II toxin-antitoxin system HicB family antitoxin [Chthoniobacterales bacterium]
MTKSENRPATKDLWSVICQNESQAYHDFMTVKAVVHTAEEGGFWAEVPALPGCVTQGETMEELRVNLEDAIKLWFEAGEPEMMATEGDQIVELAI